MAAAHIAPDFPKHPLLCIGQVKRQALFVKPVEIFSHMLKHIPLETICVDQFEFQKFELCEEQFVKLQPERGLREFLVVFRIMDIDKGIAKRHQVQLLHHLLGHRLRNDVLDLG